MKSLLRSLLCLVVVSLCCQSATATDWKALCDAYRSCINGPNGYFVQTGIKDLECSEACGAADDERKDACNQDAQPWTGRYPSNCACYQAGSCSNWDTFLEGNGDFADACSEYTSFNSNWSLANAYKLLGDADYSVGDYEDAAGYYGDAIMKYDACYTHSDECQAKAESAVGSYEEVCVE